MTTSSLSNQIQEAQQLIAQVKQEMGRFIVGQTHLINCLLIAVLADGHLLLEGVPGIAKTLAANTFARLIACEFKRVQFTPDLLPADLVGTQIYNPKDGSFTVKPGPIFTNILLADEINRAPAKVQAALLEVMQEKQVTIGGETFSSPAPFLVLATQNPIEQEGTYPLSEAQTDRFLMKVTMTYPSPQEEHEILRRMGSSKPLAAVRPLLTADVIFHLRELVDAIYLDDRVIDYLLRLVGATRDPKAYGVDTVGLLEYGASPRASLALQRAARARALLAGRYFVTPQDIKSVCHDVLRHRLRLSYEAEADHLSTDQVIDRIVNTLVVP